MADRSQHRWSGSFLKIFFLIWGKWIIIIRNGQEQKRKEMKMELQDKEVLVIGTGISGIGAARLLLQVGARPVLFDGNE